MVKGVWMQTARQLESLAYVLAMSGGAQPEDRWARAQHQLDYQRVHDAAIEIVGNPEIGLALVHWPVPHTSRGPTSAHDLDEYLENLVRADRALAEVRAEMERAGLWETTTIIVTSDHGFRNDAALDAPINSHELRLPLVPFLLKLPGRAQPLEYAPPFNTVLTRDLIQALLGGELSTSDDVASWLDRHRGSAPEQGHRLQVGSVR